MVKAMRTAPMTTRAVLTGLSVIRGLFTGFVFAKEVLKSSPGGRWNSRHSVGSFASRVGSMAVAFRFEPTSLTKRVTTTTTPATIWAGLGLRNILILRI